MSSSLEARVAGLEAVARAQLDQAWTCEVVSPAMGLALPEAEARLRDLYRVLGAEPPEAGPEDLASERIRASLAHLDEAEALGRQIDADLAALREQKAAWHAAGLIAPDHGRRFDLVEHLLQCLASRLMRWVSVRRRKRRERMFTQPMADSEGVAAAPGEFKSDGDEQLPLGEAVLCFLTHEPAQLRYLALEGLQRPLVLFHVLSSVGLVGASNVGRVPEGGQTASGTRSAGGQ